MLVFNFVFYAFVFINIILMKTGEDVSEKAKMAMLTLSCCLQTAMQVLKGRVSCVLKCVNVLRTKVREKENSFHNTYVVGMYLDLFIY